MQRLDVKKSRLTTVCVVLLGIIIVPLGCGGVYSGIMDRFQWSQITIGLVTLSLLGIILWFISRGDRRSICYLTEEGVTRNDGLCLPWTDLLRVVDRVRIRSDGKKLIWRTEIEFQKEESAWLIPTRVANYGEIYREIRSRGGEYVEQ